MSKRKKKPKGKGKLPPLPEWRCQVPRCGSVFHAREDAIMGEAMRRVAGALTGRMAPPVVCLCGECREPHYVQDDASGLRLLTPAERFELECSVPRGLAAMQAATPDLTRPLLGVLLPEP